jgi:hypothetical protein
VLTNAPPGIEKDNPLVTEITNIEFQDALARYIRERYVEAYNHKVQNGTETRCLRNLRCKKAVYQPEELSMVGEIDVYIGIAALKSRAAESWLLDVVMNTMEKPWTLTPSPIPDLPADVKEQAITMLSNEISDPNSGMQTMDDVRQRAGDLKKAVLAYLTKQAKESTGAMEQLIEEQMDEGLWKKTFAEFLADLCTYPAALIRAPVVVQKMKATYKGNAVVAESVGLPSTRCISPFDAYPSPASTTTQDGDYFLERVRYSRAKLYELKDIESFDEVNVRLALKAYPNGFQLNQNHDWERDRLEGTAPDIQYSTRLLDVLIYNGVLPGHFLIAKGVLVDDPQRHYESEIWVCGDFTLRAVLNPNPVSARPIHSTSFAKRNGAFWGDSPIDLVYDIQRVCNSLVRAMVRNAAYSSGPMAEVAADRFASGEDITQLDPYRMYFVQPDLSGTGGKAIQFNSVPSVLAELTPTLDRFMKMADDISGIPAYVIGNPQVSGAGRTMGGLSMLMGNAAKGIKSVMLNIDNDCISEVVRSFYYFNLVTSDDPTIKSDADIVAQGTSGLLQRELQQSRMTELLQLLTPYVQMQVVTPQAIQYMLRQVLADQGLDVDKIIPDPDAQEAQQQAARQQVIQQAAGGQPADQAKPQQPPVPGVQGAISASGPSMPALPTPAQGAAPAGAAPSSGT